jgi:hypothetical protein
VLIEDKRQKSKDKSFEEYLSSNALIEDKRQKSKDKS